MNELNVEETLRKGIRAVRRGHEEPARRLLIQVVRADPKNEEAWLWLSRVAETPEQRATCLERVVDLNPENRWAQEQLQAMAGAPAPPPLPAEAEAEAAETSAPPAPAEADLEVELLQCPQCGAPLTPRAGADTRTLVCGHCNSILDLTEEQASVVGETRLTKPLQPIKPGMEATFGDTRYQVIGWLRYEGWDDEDTWTWDEWLLISSEGAYLWLSYDREAGFVIQHKIRPTKAFEPTRARFTGIPVPGGTARVIESAPARVTAIEGELTWRAQVGERLRYMDARLGDRRYSLEYGTDEIELYEGREISPIAVWRAFGRDDLVAQVKARAQVRGRYKALGVVTLVVAVISMLLALYGAMSGQELLKQTAQLSATRREQAVGPIEVTDPNRAYRVKLRTSLPVNNWAVVNVTANGPQENEFYLFAEEFWDEEGYDDGYWHESDTRARRFFRPDTTGPYYLTLELDEATVSALNVAVEVVGPVWVSGYPTAFAVICGFLGYIFLMMGAGTSPSAPLSAFLEMAEDD
jgi:hypothetical protein